MPVIDISLQKMNHLLGQDLSLDELEEYFLQLGADIEDKKEDTIKVEYNPNRPDYCSLPGFARALKGIIGLEKGIPDYPLKKSGMTVKVEESVKAVRPFIHCAVIRNVELDEEAIAELMNIQEALHWVVGRDRRKASIGIHDLKDIEAPFSYLGVEADSHPFVPLGEKEEMTPQEICRNHPKGRDYAHLVDEDGIVPFLIDKNEGVLSFPPIINGVLTLVTEKTTDLFIDVTGTDENAVKYCLTILTSSFAELGCQVETVTVEPAEGKKLQTPDFSLRTKELRIAYVNEILGLDLSRKEIEENLLKARLGIRKPKKGEQPSKKDSILVEIPAFRIDILHEVDLIEEVAISYGYHNMVPELDEVPSVGRQHPKVQLQYKTREILAGLGFTEMVNFTLVSRDWHYTLMQQKGRPVTLLNPVSSEFNIFRDSLLPGLLKNLEKNKPVSLPQKLFEVGDISRINKKLPTKTTREISLAGVIISSQTDFVEIKGNVEAILKAFGIENYSLASTEHPSFFEGRCAEIVIKKKTVGIFGEIHPEVLINFELENPVSAFELELEALM
ncbi:MAG: phenylalanine--tRNA ligase subunit beta [Candidatus Heimdallarchaeota archaeon]|nr:phenylalanine--tRNA ligase subunit beta [Candidatus Heimdallarchaeota archaeon]